MQGILESSTGLDRVLKTRSSAKVEALISNSCTVFRSSARGCMCSLQSSLFDHVVRFHPAQTHEDLLLQVDLVFQGLDLFLNNLQPCWHNNGANWWRLVSAGTVRPFREQGLLLPGHRVE